MIFFKFAETIAASPAKRDRIVLINILLCLLINIGLWLGLFWNFSKFSDYIILQYNIYFGISWLAPWYLVFILPALGLLWALIDFPLAFYFYLKQQILSYLLAFTATLLNLVFLIVALLLAYVN